jgi:hypothetical protein
MVCENESGKLVYSLSSFHNIETLEKTFERDPAFNLADFWNDWWENYGRDSIGYNAKLRVSPHAVPFLPWFFGSKIKGILEKAPVDEEQWKIVNVSFHSLPHARSRILALGSAVEVLEPLPLRMSVADYGAQITSIYSAQTKQQKDPNGY